ncbi:MAG: hypothetical protein KJZ86_02620 [Caldilineaceae bacterium]|nr:hypothetical protein [Caldilineaceae bacterium]HRJ40479.1 hypothetical protein [Caldilineaceae bacterium]
MRTILPPFLWDFALHLWHSQQSPEWEHIPEGWTYADTHPEIAGWDVQSVVDVYRAKWPAFAAAVQSRRPLDFSHESPAFTGGDLNAHNAAMTFGYVLGRVAGDRSSLSLLDWGGGSGHYFLLAQALYPDLSLDYHCRDLPLLADYGAQVLPEQTFSSDDSCLERRYDLVMANTSLHYSQAWRAVLGRLAQAATGFLYVGNFPLVADAPSFVFVQRAQAYGYATEYLGWCLNRDEFLEEAARLGLALQREFVYGYAPPIHNAPGQAEYRGFLFRAGNTD